MNWLEVARAIAPAKFTNELKTPQNAMSPYLVRARIEFCRNTGFSAPHEVVESGQKSLSDWTETLSRHRSEAKHLPENR